VRSKPINTTDTWKQEEVIHPEAKIENGVTKRHGWGGGGLRRQDVFDGGKKSDDEEHAAEQEKMENEMEHRPEDNNEYATTFHYRICSLTRPSGFLHSTWKPLVLLLLLPPPQLLLLIIIIIITGNYCRLILATMRHVNTF
jgi:hypothetical protein